MESENHMEFFRAPNCPHKQVTLAVVDGRLSKPVETALAVRGITAVKTKKHRNLYEAVSFHPDMVIHHLGDEYIVYAPGTDEWFLHTLSGLGFKLIKGEACLAPAYPYDIAYNVARIGNVAMHNLRYTDTILKNELLKRDVKLVHVNQGYTKCSVSVVDENSIITSDSMIAGEAERNGINALLIKQQNRIVLNGLNHGFIGGSSGRLRSNRLGKRTPGRRKEPDEHQYDNDQERDSAP